MRSRACDSCAPRGRPRPGTVIVECFTPRRPPAAGRVSRASAIFAGTPHRKAPTVRRARGADRTNGQRDASTVALLQLLPERPPLPQILRRAAWRDEHGALRSLRPPGHHVQPRRSSNAVRPASLSPKHALPVNACVRSGRAPRVRPSGGRPTARPCHAARRGDGGAVTPSDLPCRRECPPSSCRRRRCS